MAVGINWCAAAGTFPYVQAIPSYNGRVVVQVPLELIGVPLQEAPLYTFRLLALQAALDDVQHQLCVVFVEHEKYSVTDPQSTTVPGVPCWQDGLKQTSACLQGHVAEPRMAAISASESLDASCVRSLDGARANNTAKTARSNTFGSRMILTLI
jgi:hypothetical protein